MSKRMPDLKSYTSRTKKQSKYQTNCAPHCGYSIPARLIERSDTTAIQRLNISAYHVVDINVFYYNSHQLQNKEMNEIIMH